MRLRVMGLFLLLGNKPHYVQRKNIARFIRKWNPRASSCDDFG